MSRPANPHKPDWLTLVGGGLCLLLTGLLLALTLLYHSLPGTSALSKLTILPVEPGIRAAILATADCQPERFDADPVAIIRTVWLDQPQGCHRFSHRLALDLFHMTRPKPPSRLEEVLMTLRLENELSAQRTLALALSQDPLAVAVQPASPAPDTPLNEAAIAQLIQETRQLVQANGSPTQTAAAEPDSIQPASSPSQTQPKPKPVRRSAPRKQARRTKPATLARPPVPEQLAGQEGLTVAMPLEGGVSCQTEKPKGRWKRLKAWVKRSWSKLKDRPEVQEPVNLPDSQATGAPTPPPG